mmetsp:Transcript_2839/g.6686  ORF Transcript_2839/g.6686 Transcript_2839/m.6686 type:complete len:92 (+) Transcript_2839:1453-1728(+)
MITCRNRLFPGCVIDALLSGPHSTSAANSLQQSASSGISTGVLLDNLLSLASLDVLEWPGNPFVGIILAIIQQVPNNGILASWRYNRYILC